MLARDLALDEMTELLKNLGISEADIAKARAEAVKLNSDQPMKELCLGSSLFAQFR